ncbi:DNA-processing protein DprA [Mesobacillus foraminis]|uniref:DNA-processing protein DprA n=1 Tax=Mesobacillus foraminis TaxID=279826 RepID=UPI001BE95079|nr:DNA-processing protein DprA [Mesobacillus foraminis]MBT2756028.1 DNA-processing protein DprA [Mesobacillus foraminis]
MDEFKKRLIHLVHCKHISWKTIAAFLKEDPELSFVSSSHPRSNSSAATTHSSTIPDSILKNIPIDNLLERYQHDEVTIISFFDREYPAILKSIYQPPWVLFAKGDTSLLEAAFPLAVVGSREASLYGKQVIDFLFPELIKHGAVVFSGLAKGIDTLAHLSAINHHGRTVAVIAGGFEHIYPKQNKELAEKLMREHLIISEYPPGTRPEKWHFPFRNRIISGLSKGTLVIEAKRRSGSFITADFALNEGREVFAVPGSILSPSHTGTNDLIQMGAKLVKEPKDIIEEIFL